MNITRAVRLQQQRPVRRAQCQDRQLLRLHQPPGRRPDARLWHARDARRAGAVHRRAGASRSGWTRSSSASSTACKTGDTLVTGMTMHPTGLVGMPRRRPPRRSAGAERPAQRAQQTARQGHRPDVESAGHAAQRRLERQGGADRRRHGHGERGRAGDRPGHRSPSRPRWPPPPWACPTNGCAWPPRSTPTTAPTSGRRSPAA